MKQIDVINLGLTSYTAAWELQRKIHELRVEGKTRDVLLLNEHRHVYTLGKNSRDEHLLAYQHELEDMGAEVHRVDRGGDVTYHGPGQLVGYPILNLGDYYCDIHRYLRDIEEVMIRTLADFGIKSRRDGDFTGVWAGNDKIAAIGVKVSRWYTMHGFALNVNTDLSYFDRIIPCGIFHKGVTSMERLLGKKLDLEDIARSTAAHFADVFGASIVERSKEEYLQTINHLSNESVGCR